MIFTILEQLIVFVDNMYIRQLSDEIRCEGTCVCTGVIKKYAVADFKLRVIVKDEDSVVFDASTATDGLMSKGRAGGVVIYKY